MANIIDPSTFPVNSATPSTKGSLQSPTSLSVSFSEALARLKERDATNNGVSPSSAGNDRTILSVDSGSKTSSSLTAGHFHLKSLRNGTDEEGFNERALALRAYRQELIASNIANADTPGYKAIDFDIQEALRTGKTAKTVELKYVVPGQSSIDGNTVEMDIERVKFTENAIMYEYQIDRVRGHYKDMEDLLKNTPY